MQIGQRVRVTATGALAAKDETGTVTELRGYNYEHGKRIAQYVTVWIDHTPDGSPTRRVIPLCTTQLEKE